MFGELEFYKKRCDVLEKDLVKSQNTIKKMDVSLKKLQEINTINAKVRFFFSNQSLNNTSIPFFLTSEFKNNWENLAKDQIMEAFENTFEDYFWLAHVVNDTLLIVYNETNKLIYEKINVILSVLNIEEKEPEKFFSRFRTFFQEYFMSIFAFSEEFANKVKSRLYEIILKYKNFPENTAEGCKSDIETKAFKNFCQIVYKLCLYMILHEPKLTLSVQNYEKREFSYHYYNKSDFLNIEGFGNEQSSCIIILDPPMIRNYLPFQGIKPCVYIVPNPNEEIIKICEMNKEIKKNKPKKESLSAPANDEAEKSLSPSKIEKKLIEEATQLEKPSEEARRFPIKNSKTQVNQKVTVPKDIGKEKSQTNYMKYNKNIGRDIFISDSIRYD
jgi:hypothetical protein